MKYTTPITDRTILDVYNRTSKGIFSLSDWQRIYNNTKLLWALEEVIIGGGALFTEPTEMTINTIPTDGDINAIVDNIENVRSVVVYETGKGGDVIPLVSDWGGPNSPKYSDINKWENNIDLLLNYVTNGYTGWDTSTGSGRFPRTDNAVCGTGTTRQNGFRRYA